MKAQSKRGSLVEAISNGIASRDFYIVPNPDEIPGCCGNLREKLEYAGEFARENGWNLTVHDGNGWLLFTAAGRPAPKRLGNGNFGQFLKLIELSLRESHPAAEAVPVSYRTTQGREIRPRI